MLAFEFEPPTPRIALVRARTHSPLEPFPCLFDPLVCPNTAEQWYKSQVVSLTIPERVYYVRALRSDRTEPFSHQPNTGHV